MGAENRVNGPSVAPLEQWSRGAFGVPVCVRSRPPYASYMRARIRRDEAEVRVNRVGRVKFLRNLLAAFAPPDREQKSERE